MPVIPQPPINPDSVSSFLEHVNAHPDDWMKYLRLAHEGLVEGESAAASLRVEVQRYRDQTLRQAAQIELLEADRVKSVDKAVAETERVRQDFLVMAMEKASAIAKMDAALAERDRALAKRDEVPLAIHPTICLPALDTPSTSRTEPPVNTPVGTTLPPTFENASTAHLSERLPDPDKFDGDRKDLRRFVSQVHEKMKANKDRFPSAQSRMAYVTSRLKGAAYAQILPYVREGICQLGDYDQILNTLTRAFGDPTLLTMPVTTYSASARLTKTLVRFLPSFSV